MKFLQREFEIWRGWFNDMGNVAAPRLEGKEYGFTFYGAFKKLHRKSGLPEKWLRKGNNGTAWSERFIYHPSKEHAEKHRFYN